ncbi:MAG: hypothetical protein QNJ41_05130 [Xenococcaceae cyanobacterium MO_188.B32]|nr:hypothetical protein [Xenococcaceae cyanobacterium MO_188.B32]
MFLNLKLLFSISTGFKTIIALSTELSGRGIFSALGDFQERIYHLLKGKTNAA